MIRYATSPAQGFAHDEEPAPVNDYNAIDVIDLTDQRLCFFLSDIFVDNETDYKQIAWFARHFPLDHVKKALFEWVAPVCYLNLMSPAPSIWFCFDPDELWDDIQKNIQRQKSRNPYMRIKILVRDWYIKKAYWSCWQQLVQQINVLNDQFGNVFAKAPSL